MEPSDIQSVLNAHARVPLSHYVFISTNMVPDWFCALSAGYHKTILLLIGLQSIYPFVPFV